MIALLSPIEFVKYTLQLWRRNATAFVNDLQGYRIFIPQTSDRYRGVGGRIFRGIVQKVKKHLLKQYRVELQHRQISGELKRNSVPREDLAGAPQCATDDLADIVRRRIRHDGAGFQLGHVEQIRDKAVEPLGFVDHSRKQVGLFGIGKF